MKRKVLLAVLLSALVLTLMPTTPALARGSSDEVLLANSLRHYLQALEGYNSGDYSSVAGLLQAAASNAKHVNPELAGLIEDLRAEFGTSSSVQTETIRVNAGPIASIYNDCFPTGYVFPDGYVFISFNPSNPLTFTSDRIREA